LLAQLVALLNDIAAVIAQRQRDHRRERTDSCNVLSSLDNRRAGRRQQSVVHASGQAAEHKRPTAQQRNSGAEQTETILRPTILSRSICVAHVSLPSLTEHPLPSARHDRSIRAMAKERMRDAKPERKTACS